ncbi:MAG: glutathione S-transferase family protein [Gammaproteobacteria bacterium]|nr:glutathione S-transferase family protein [Gammaproteobacteria bacterium]
MIRLYQFRRTWGIPNPSPFCMKLELFLRMTGIEYECAWVDVPKGPKGKAPWIEDGGTRIGDSALIIDFLRKKYGIDPDAGLTPTQRAVSRAFASMLDEHLYWALVYSRWIDERNWPALRQDFFGALPPVVRSVVPVIARRRIRAQLWQHGLGRHTGEEIYALGCSDIAALGDYLGDQPYFHGDDVSLADASVAAFAIALLKPPFDSPLKRAIEQRPNLAAYCERMLGRYFPELGAAAAGDSATGRESTA